MKNLIFLIIFSIVSSSTSVFAQQSNFMINPPPIPWFEFKESQKDLRVNATTLYLTGDNSGEISGKTKVYGAGASGVYRYAFKDVFAFDIGLTLVGATGQIGKAADMNMFLGSLPFDLEILFFNNETISVTGFIGFSFTYNYTGIESFH